MTTPDAFTTCLETRFTTWLETSLYKDLLLFDHAEVYRNAMQAAWEAGADAAYRPAYNQGFEGGYTEGYTEAFLTNQALQDNTPEKD
jgi:hypothetical protein